MKKWLIQLLCSHKKVIYLEHGGDRMENIYCCKRCGKEIKWQLTKINQGYQMTGISDDSISIDCRPLTWFERLKYWGKIK